MVCETGPRSAGSADGKRNKIMTATKIGMFGTFYSLWVKAVSSAIAVAAGDSPLLGLAVFRDRQGQPDEPRQDDGIFPEPAYSASALERGHGGLRQNVRRLALVARLGSRVLTIPLIFTMIIAYVTAESDSLKVFSATRTNLSPPTHFFSCSRPSSCWSSGRANFRSTAGIARLFFRKKPQP